MPSYVILCNVTEQGVRSGAGSAAIDELRNAFDGLPDGALRSFQLSVTFGEYDAVAFADVASGTDMAGLLMGLAAQGNLRTRSLNAIPIAGGDRSIQNRAAEIDAHIRGDTPGG